MKVLSQNLQNLLVVTHGTKCNILQKKHRIKVGKCETADCPETTNLDAAHVRGKERPVIISNLLSEYIENGIVKIDLDEFEEKFIEAHHPIENTIKILCKTCHRKYDNAKEVHELAPKDFDSSAETDEEIFEVHEGKTIQSLVDKIIMNKAKAIARANGNTNHPQLNNQNTIFSNINSSVDVWWLEPINEKFKTNLTFLLFHADNNSIFRFDIPANSILNPEQLFDQKSQGKSRIIIEKSASKFVDKKSGFDFSKYLTETL